MKKLTQNWVGKLTNTIGNIKSTQNDIYIHNNNIQKHNNQKTWLLESPLEIVRPSCNQKC